MPAIKSPTKGIVDRVAIDRQVSKAEATAIVMSVFDAISAVVQLDETARIPGFGSFQRRFRETRTMRNPRTGESVTKVAHHFVRFREEKPRARK